MIDNKTLKRVVENNKRLEKIWEQIKKSYILKLGR